MLSRAARWGRSWLPAVLNPSSVTNRVVPVDCEELVEGLARVIFQKGHVFYNPVQVVNRDLSVLVLRWFQRQRPGRPLRILEALSATGLRAIRYAKEVPDVSRVVANDLDPGAVRTISRNIEHNGPDVLQVVTPNCGDAIAVMTAARDPSDQFDVVDLDPYGGAAPFLDSAVQAVADGGVLAVTCTDLAVLCGNSPEICFARYGAAPLKGASTHEMAVRIVLFAINAAANRHGRSVEVLVCCKIDFYVRLFVRVRNSRALAQMSHSRTCSVFQCAGCGTQRLQPLGRVKENVMSNTKKRKKKEAARASAVPKPTEAQSNGRNNVETSSDQMKSTGVKKFAVGFVANDVKDRCSICDGPMCVGGPIWSGPLVDRDVCESILADLESGAGAFEARERVEALLRLLNEEVPHAPLFLQLNTICGVLKVSAPPAAAVRTYLLSKGYSVSQSHTDPLALKTNARPEIIWDIMRLWVKDLKKAGKLKHRGKVNGDANGEQTLTAGERILVTEPCLVSQEEVDFSVKKDKFVRQQATGERKKAARFLPNPEPYWGPKARARSGTKRTRDDACLDE